MKRFFYPLLFILVLTTTTKAQHYIGCGAGINTFPLFCANVNYTLQGKYMAAQANLLLNKDQAFNTTYSKQLLFGINTNSEENLYAQVMLGFGNTWRYAPGDNRGMFYTKPGYVVNVGLFKKLFSGSSQLGVNTYLYRYVYEYGSRANLANASMMINGMLSYRCYLGKK